MLASKFGGCDFAIEYVATNAVSTRVAGCFGLYLDFSVELARVGCWLLD